jgi:hypothetical protein
MGMWLTCNGGGWLQIADGVPDDLIRAMLDACGAVESWKRVTDPGTNKPKSFGFAEFVDAEGALTALATLNELQLYSQALLVKGNKDTIAYLVMHPLAMSCHCVFASHGISCYHRLLEVPASDVLWCALGLQASTGICSSPFQIQRRVCWACWLRIWIWQPRAQEEYKAKKAADAAAAAAGPTNKIIAAPILTIPAAEAATQVKPEVKAEPAPAAKDVEKDVAAVKEAVKALVDKMLPQKSASAQYDPPSPALVVVAGAAAHPPRLLGCTHTHTLSLSLVY